MADVFLEDQPGGVSLVLADADTPVYYPPATTGAARVVLYARDKDKGIDTAEPVAEGKPGGQFSMRYAALANRDLLFATISYSASNVPSSDLENADWGELPVEANSGTAAGIDENVPSVTLPPVVSKVSAEELLILIPAPANASTWTDGKIRVRRADTLEVITIWDVLAGPQQRITQPPMACVVDYNCRNQSEEDIGNGRGVSDWSPTAAAPGLNDADQPPPASEAMNDFDFDPDDHRAGIVKGIISA